MCYEVEFANPKLVPGAPVGGAVHFSGTTPTTANNFATATQATGATLSGITLGTNTITWPAGVAGNYFVSLSVNGTTTTAFGAVSGLTGNLAIFTTANTRDNVNFQESLAGTTTSPAVLLLTAVIPNAGGTLTITPSTINTGTGMDLFIFSLPSSVLTVTQKEQIEIEDLQGKFEAMAAERDLMQSRLLRLEGLLSPPSEVDVESPDECKEQMDKSVHLNRSAVAKLLGLK